MKDKLKIGYLDQIVFYIDMFGSLQEFRVDLIDVNYMYSRSNEIKLGWESRGRKWFDTKNEGIRYLDAHQGYTCVHEFRDFGPIKHE